MPRNRKAASSSNEDHFRGSINHDAIGVPGIRNRYKYIDLSALTHQFTDQVGLSEFPPFPADMSKRNAFRGPGAWNIDSGLYKNLKLTERFTLQLRLEAYNVFNHANLLISGGEADIGQGPFVPAYFDGRRNIQIAGKFIF